MIGGAPAIMPRLLATVGVTAGIAGVVDAGVTSWLGESSDPTYQQVVVGGVLPHALIVGGAAGILGGIAAAFLPGGARISSLRAGLMIPVGIAGAAAGARLAQLGLEARYGDEYASQRALLGDSVAQSQAMLRAAGPAEFDIPRVSTSYDRSFYNASFLPWLVAPGGIVTLGRSAHDGSPMDGLDVVAHEYAHAVVYRYAPTLLPVGESGMLHESLADTFAMAVDTGNWLVGEDAYSGGLRSFSDPHLRGGLTFDGTPYPAPIHRTQLNDDTETHDGAGIGNRAAWYFGANFGRAEMARLYVRALEIGELGLGSGYEDLARALRAASVELYGDGSNEAFVVDYAWKGAGYWPPGETPPLEAPTKPPGSKSNSDFGAK